MVQEQISVTLLCTEQHKIEKRKYKINAGPDIEPLTVFGSAITNATIKNYNFNYF